ncbi:MAG: hypothetical protein OEM52_01710 [bacterium]|nr:hypothetical protein [bacterium]
MRIVFLMALVVLLLAGCDPNRQEYGLSPIIYISPSAQERLARTVLDRVTELQWMVEDDLQRGFALSPPRDPRYEMTDSSFYLRRFAGDTLYERVKFIPDIWAASGQTLDSVKYRWEQVTTDTINNTNYRYAINAKRIAEGALPRLTGDSYFRFIAYAIAGDGYRYNYSYALNGAFNFPGGTPPIGGATVRWSGNGITWEGDGIPSNWALAGTSQAASNGNWTISFTLEGEAFLRATIDSTGTGTFQIGWDAFRQVFPFTASNTRNMRAFLPSTILSATAQERLARTLLGRGTEVTNLVRALQRGYAIPHPYQDSANYPMTDSLFYARLDGDTSECVRFVPNVWRTGGIADSVLYRWSVLQGDTAANGVFAYRINARRLAPDSLARLTGFAGFDYRYWLNGYDFSYNLASTFDEPGGAPPPWSGADYQWSGNVVTWEEEDVPVVWEMTGRSQRDANARWTTSFSLMGDELIRANTDTTGNGSFWLAADDFIQQYIIP